MLKDTDYRLIACLIESPSLRQACRMAGCSMNTLKKRLSQYEFRKELDNAKMAVLETAVNKATSAMSDAVTRLQKIVNDDEAQANNQIASAKVLLEYGLRLFEFHDALTADREVFDDVL